MPTAESAEVQVSPKVDEGYVLRYIKDFTAGTCGGMAQVISGHPFDTLKVRLQTQGMHGAPVQFTGPIDCLTKSIKTDGFLSLYRGMGPPLAMVGVVTAFEFGFWGFFKKVIMHVKGDTTTPLTVYENALAGSLTGFVTSLVYTPTELVKARLQVQFGDSVQYKGPIDVVRKVLKSDGVLGLWRGFLPTVAREVPSNACYFGGYEVMKYLMIQPGQTEKDLGLLKLTFCGSVAGILNWIASLPQDVVKSRMQVDKNYKGSMDCIRQIWKAEGIRGFYRGLTPAVVRAVPANGATFLAYELCLKFIDK